MTDAEKKERRREYLKRYKAENGEKIKAANAAYYQKNRKRHNEYTAKNQHKYAEQRRGYAATHRKEKVDYDRRRRLEKAEEVRAAKKAYYEKNKESVKAKQRARYLSRIEQYRESGRKWVEKNKERKKEADRLYLQNNRHKVRETARKYREQNKNKIQDFMRKWAKKNADKVRFHHAMRRAQKRKAPIREAKQIAAWDKEWKSRGFVKCYWCLKVFLPDECHPDHIIPLANGGEHSLLNLCISCIPCNIRKKAKSLSKWNTEIEQPVLF